MWMNASLTSCRSLFHQLQDLCIRRFL